MERILITGATGFVGRHLLEALQERYPKAVLCLLDHPSTHICGGGGFLEIEGAEVRLAADLACADDLRLALERLMGEVGPPDAVFHLAAQAAVGRSFESPAVTYEVNVVGTARLLEVLADITPRARVLIPSSAQVYAMPAGEAAVGAAAAAAARGGSGGSPLSGQAGESMPLDESAPTSPTSHYGVSKFAQEEVGRLFFEATGLPVLITRAFNHIGPGQGTGFVVPDLARQIAVIERDALREEHEEEARREAELAASVEASGVAPGATLKVGNLEARRDYLDVRDVVAAYLDVIEKGEPGRPYNVASGETWSARELLDLMLEEARAPIQVQVDPKLLRPTDIPILVGNSSRLHALGWRPTHDVHDTVGATLDYWRRMVGARVGRGRAERDIREA